MKALTCFTLLAVTLVPAIGICCFQIPKKIHIGNSPYFFDSFDVSGDGIKFNAVEEGQSFHLSCNRNQDDGDHQWHLTIFQDGKRVMEQDMPGGALLTDDKEIPTVTQIDLKQGSSTSATGKITMEGDPSRWIELLCKETDNQREMEVQHRSADSELPLGRIRARSSSIARSLTLQNQPPRPQKFGFDFKSNDPTQLDLAGCGVTDDQGGTNGQQN